MLSAATVDASDQLVLLPVRSTVLFPGIVVPVAVGRERSGHDGESSQGSSRHEPTASGFQIERGGSTCHRSVSRREESGGVAAGVPLYTIHNVISAPKTLINAARNAG